MGTAAEGIDMVFVAGRDDHLAALALTSVPR